jgi:hypothetical protein
MKLKFQRILIVLAIPFLFLNQHIYAQKYSCLECCTACEGCGFSQDTTSDWCKVCRECKSQFSFKTSDAMDSLILSQSNWAAAINQCTDTFPSLLDSCIILHTPATSTGRWSIASPQFPLILISNNGPRDDTAFGLLIDMTDTTTVDSSKFIAFVPMGGTIPYPYSGPFIAGHHYSLIVLSANTPAMDSSGTAIFDFSIPVSVIDKSKSAVSIYPNPTAGKFTIYTGNNLGNQRFEIVNPLGQVVQAGFLEGSTAEIHLEGSNSIYTLMLENGMARRILLQKQ